MTMVVLAVLLLSSIAGGMAATAWEEAQSDISMVTDEAAAFSHTQLGELLGNSPLVADFVTFALK